MPPARAVLFLATLAVAVLLGRSVLISPVPLVWAVTACLAYAAILLSGVFVLRLRMFADAVVRGPKGARGVVLTFDDGPDPVTTRKVLSALDAEGAKATFFVIAEKAEKEPDLVREMVARGHTVGLHSYAHPRLFALLPAAAVEKDLLRGIDVLTLILGERPVLFRPPIGHTTPAIARIAGDLGLVVVGWSVSGFDGIRAASRDAVVARVARGLADGAIVLLHDAAERGDFEPTAPDTVPGILHALHAKRLPVVPISAWIATT